MRIERFRGRVHIISLKRLLEATEDHGDLGLPLEGVRKTFDREVYWTCFAASGLGAVVLMVAAQRMNGSGAVSWWVLTL
jgi:hypothetical protein